MRKLSIAIDGPAGAGKSTVAKLIASRLGYTYLDTGAMYRAVTWAALQGNVPPEGLPKLAESLRMEIKRKADSLSVFLDGKDVTDELRTPEVSAGVSAVSAVPEVRRRMVEIQRTFAAAGGTVLDGRDIGTVVLPDADVKVFLTASPRTRAERRYKDMKAKHPGITVDEIEEQIRRRDETDSTRKTSPLRPADDAALLDNSKLTLEETVDTIIALCERKLGGPCGA